MIEHREIGTTDMGSWELERWRGSVDARLNSIDTHLQRLEETIANSIREMRETVEKTIERAEQHETAAHKDFEARIRTLESSFRSIQARLAIVLMLVLGTGISKMVYDLFATK